MLGKLVWLVISAVAAGSLAVVAGLVNPGEKVNALWLVTAAACFYLVAYRFYGAFLAAKALSLPNYHQSGVHSEGEGIGGRGGRGEEAAGQLTRGGEGGVHESLLDLLLKWYGYLTERRPITTGEVLELEEAL